MEDDTLSKLGGTCSILVGVSYLVVGITFALQPAELRMGADAARFYPSLAQDPTMHMLFHLALALSAVFGIAAVLAISEIVQPANEGWVRWTSNLAYLGFAVLAIEHFRELALEPARAAAFVAGDAATRAAIEATILLETLDPHGWLGFGAVGLWVFVVSLLAFRGGTLPKPLAYLGIAVSLLYWLVVAGLVLQIEALTAIASGVGSMIAAPIWYIWMGLRLRRANA